LSPDVKDIEDTLAIHFYSVLSSSSEIAGLEAFSCTYSEHGCRVYVMSFSFVCKCQPCGGDCCLFLWSNLAFFCPEDAGAKFLWNVCTYLPNYTASHPRGL
jgi:hypothetical protein